MEIFSKPVVPNSDSDVIPEIVEFWKVGKPAESVGEVERGRVWVEGTARSALLRAVDWEYLEVSRVLGVSSGVADLGRLVS